MTTFEGSRAAARRVRGAAQGVSERIRVGAEQQAQMMRNARAVEESQQTRAYQEMKSARLATADAQARSIIQSGEAKARAKSAIGELMNNLGATFVATAQRVEQANVDANLAEHKIDLQKQVRRAVIAAETGQPIPTDVYSLAAKDAYAEAERQIDLKRQVRRAVAAAETGKPIPEDVYALVAKDAYSAAEHEIDLQNQARRAVAAANANQPIPADVYSLAAQDAYAERAASLQAHRDAAKLATELEGITDPTAVYDHVHETMAKNAQGMEDPAYREYYLNSLRTLGDQYAAKREASIIQERKTEQYNVAVDSVVVEMIDGTITDPDTFMQRVESARLAAPKGMRRGFEKDIASRAIKVAAERGELHKLMPMLAQTEVLERNPVLSVGASGAVYTENKARQKAYIDQQSALIGGVLSRVMTDKAATLADLDEAFMAIGAFQGIEGAATVDSGRSLATRIQTTMPELLQKYELAERYQQWADKGGTFSEEFTPFVNKEISLALQQGNFTRIERLITETGHIPKFVLDNLHGVFKGRDGTIDPEAFARHAPLLETVLRADQMSNGSLLYGIEDPKASLLLRALRDQMDQGTDLRPALSAVMGEYPPDVLTRISEFDAEKALADKDYDIVLDRQVSTALTNKGWWGKFASLFSGGAADVDGLEGVDPGRFKKDVIDEIRFRSKGIDDGKLGTHMEEAIEAVAQRYAANSVPMETTEGRKAIYIPNRAMRNDLKGGLKLPNGETMEADEVLQGYAKGISLLLNDPMFRRSLPEDVDLSPENFAVTTGFMPAQTPDGRTVYKARIGLKDVPSFATYGWIIEGRDQAEMWNDRFEEQGSIYRFEPDPTTGDYALYATWDRKKLAADGEEALKFQQEVDRISKLIAAERGEGAAHSYRAAADRANPLFGPSPEEIAGMMPGGMPQVPQETPMVPPTPIQRPWKTNEEITEEGKRQALNMMTYKAMQGLQERGVISGTWGTTRTIPEVNTPEEAQKVIRDAIVDYQMNENGGLPVSSNDTPYDKTYLAERREVIEAHEGFRSRVYEDHKGIKTVGVGINMEAPDTKKFIEDAGWDYEALLSGKKQFSKAQLDILYDFKVAEAEKFVSRVIKVPLTANQRSALVSLAYNNPSLIGPNLRYFVNNQMWEDAEEEIRRRSNKNKHRGLQNRRNAEADLFSMDTHTPSTHFYHDVDVV